MIARVLTPMESLTITVNPGEPVPVEKHGYQPLIFSASDGFPPCGQYNDVTGQSIENMPTAPNLLIVEVSDVTQAWVDAVDLDARFEVIYAG